MTRAQLRAGILVAGLALLAAVASGCGSSASAGGGGPTSSTDGATLVSSLCGRCHPIDRVNAAHKSRSGWIATVSRMRAHGLSVNDEQAQAIVDYLSTHGGSS